MTFRCPLMNCLNQCYLLLITYQVVQTVVQVCNDGTFGQKCNNKCFCTSGCQSNGKCINNGPCQYRYFGPACQYMDVLYRDFNAQGVPEFLKDWDDKTCNPDPIAHSIEVEVIRPTPFTWYRMVINKPNFMYQFVTTINKNEICWNERKFNVDILTVDVTCDVHAILTSLRIFGLIARTVCSMYISAGRKVTFKENTRQSSTYMNNEITFGSSNAVDMLEDTCAVTDVKIEGTEWSVTLHRPAKIQLIQIHVKEEYTHGFQGASMIMYDGEANVLEHVVFKEVATEHNVYATASKPVHRVVLKQAQNANISKSLFALCNFDCTGEPICLHNVYGLYCENMCRCKVSDACSSITGACAAGCLPGFYGFNCSLSCNEHCVTCNSGVCSACQHGYNGENCDRECRPGILDPACLSNCSVGCTDACNNVTGHCVCKTNYDGATCTECRPGFFGPACQSKCHRGCRDICNNVTGHCICKTNYDGSNCTDCRPGSFGPACQYNCSVGCKNVCNTVTGHCHCRKNLAGLMCTECRPGTFGLNCKSKCSIGCEDICNNVTGYCTCKTDYIGLTCAELSCPEGYNCSERCICNEHEMCDVITGTCTGHCVAGYFGEKCTEECSEECNHLGCEQLNGQCHQCNPGYTGNYCSTECEEGTFGLNCGNNCSKYCTEVCDSVTGECTCQDGFTGTKCTECIESMHGDNCSLFCPVHCYRNICSAETGKCVSCSIGRTGPTCEDCADTYYGPTCGKRCSETCDNRTCDKVTGRCLVCTGGHTGLLCSKSNETQRSVSESRTSGSNAHLQTILFASICIAIILIYFVSRKVVDVPVHRAIHTL